jgi:hypothetical protein
MPVTVTPAGFSQAFRHRQTKSHRTGTTMISSFLAAVRSTLSTIDAGIARVILLFWISTLQQHRRHGRRV